MRTHLKVRANGYDFLFKYEPDYPQLLHIFVRHLKGPEDAIEIFFDGERFYNNERKRFESKTATQTLYWFWKEVDKVVYVITCFDNE